MVRPRVSILVPCYNEEKTIGRLLAAIRNQTFPVGRMEVVIADGFSTDGTREAIDAFTRACPELTILVVENPKRIIPAALNLAIQASRGQILLRLDAHSAPDPRYVDACLRLLEEGKGDMVGGVLNVVPRSGAWSARVIAAAVSHPVGVGDSMFRFSKRSQEVDTVAFCAFDRAWIDRIGGYDESLPTNEDYDFNTRLRAAGGRIWLDSDHRTDYYPPATFCGLFRQYARYGYWKAKMAAKSPNSLRWRQFLPPLAMLVLVVLLVAGIAIPAAWAIVGLGLAAYTLVLLGVGAQQAVRHGEPSLLIGIPLAIGIMHSTWAGAFLWGLRPAMLWRCLRHYPRR